MVSSIDKLAKELKKQMTASDERKPKPYDTQAEVLRVEDGVAWVHIPGGVDETPVRLTINAKKGDNVNLHVANGTAWITGNSTNPPTDDSTANYAVNISNEVKKNVTFLNTVVAENIEATNARFIDVEADTAKIHTLTAEKILATVGYIEDLTADSITTNDISAASGYIKELRADNITAQDITADHATIDSLDANYAHISNGTIDNAKIDYADVNNLSTNYAQINLANVNNAWIENGVVKDAAISDAQIIGVSANKLTAGTIDASNITVTNLNASNITTGSITVDGITIDVENNEASIDGSYIEDGTITMNGFAQEVKDVIDGAIETFTGTVVPTLNNAPANAWTTIKLKDQHIGDVYYVVNASSKQNGYCYRFSKSGSTYSWQLIKDSDVTAALQRLQTAEGKISNIESFDEEMATFKTETEGEISTLQTKTTSLETSLGDKVDKTVFNEVKQTVDGNSASITELSTITTNNGLTKTTNITNTVNTVSQTATGNSSKISSLTQTLGTNADGTTKAGDIVHRTSAVEQDLSGFKSTVSSTYETKTDASSKLNTAKTYADGKASDAEANAKADTTEKLQSYYTKTQTDSAITQRAGEISLEVAQTEINKIEIGGRNLLRHTESPTANDLAIARSTVEDGGIIRTTPTSAAAAAKFKVDYLDYADYEGKTFTVSADAKLASVESEYTGDVGIIYIGVNAISRLTSTLYGPYDRMVSKKFNLTFDWQRISFSVQIPDGLTSGTTDALIAGSQITVQLYSQPSNKPIDWRHVKLELGNKATDWTPAPEDIEAYTDTQVSAAKAEIKVTTDGISTEVSKKTSHKYLVTGNNSGASWTSFLSYAQEGATTTFSCASGALSCSVGDTVFLKYYDNTNKVWRYIRGTVAEKPIIDTSIKLTAHGYEDIRPVDTIKSTINQSADSVKIQAKHVEIDGTATFNAIKTKTDAAYDAKGAASTVQTNLDNLEIGGRNMLLETPRSHDSSIHRAYQLTLSENLKESQTYTIQFWDVDVSHSAKTADTLAVSVYWGGGSVHLLTWRGTSYFTNGHADYLTKTFTVTKSQASGSGATNAWLEIYNSVPAADGTRSLSIGKWKLEKGDKATDWTPAPEDVQAEIDTKKSVHTLMTGNAYGNTYANILGFVAEGKSQQWTVNTSATPLTNVKVGDTCRIAYKVSDMNGAYVYPTGVVTGVGNNTVDMIMHGIDTTVIDGGNILTNSIGANQIAANAITADELAANAVTANKIATNAVTSDKIAAGAITVGKINPVVYTYSNNGKGTGYAKLCTISVTENYRNKPIQFTLHSRNKNATAVSWRFLNNASPSTCPVSSATYDGDTPLYYVGTGGTYTIYFALGESYDEVKIYDLIIPYTTGLTVTWDGAYYGTSLPSGAVEFIKLAGTRTSAELDNAAKTATTYITHIDNNGIRVHPSSTQNNSVVINADGLEIFKGGTQPANSVAFYGDTARIGKESGSHLTLASDSMSMSDGTKDVFNLLQKTMYIYWNRNYKGRQFANSTDRHVDSWDTNTTISTWDSIAVNYKLNNTSKTKKITSISNGVLVNDEIYVHFNYNGTIITLTYGRGSSAASSDIIKLESAVVYYVTDKKLSQLHTGTYPNTTVSGALRIGNGTSDSNRINLMLVDWSGTGKFKGDILAFCGADSSGGMSLTKAEENIYAFKYEDANGHVYIDAYRVGRIVSLLCIVSKTASIAPGANLYQLDLTNAHLPKPLGTNTSGTGISGKNMIIGNIYYNKTVTPNRYEFVCRNGGSTAVSTGGVGFTITYICQMDEVSGEIKYMDD